MNLAQRAAREALTRAALDKTIRELRRALSDPKSPEYKYVNGPSYKGPVCKP